MNKIRYAGINRIVSNNDRSKSLLDISIENHIPHLYECGGRGRCTTCRVRVLEGMDNLNPKSSSEQKTSIGRKWDPSIRLACQAYPKGNVTIQRLIWSMGEVNALQKELAPQGTPEERYVAILFCDLRDFTALSSKNLNFDIAYMLNRFYTCLGEPILMNNGIIYQYIGDEIVGVFGTSGGSKQSICSDAIRAALGMQYALAQLNRSELKPFQVKLRSGIGINFGKAYIGHLGHPSHRQFSIIGDEVNLASRIQQYTKTSQSQILISRQVLANLNRESVTIGSTFKTRLAGKRELTRLYELTGFREMDLQLELQSSLQIILDDQQNFASTFYRKVFEQSPEIRSLFRNSMKDQGRLFLHMLTGIVYSLSRPRNLTSGLQRLGENHIKYGVKDQHYPIVKQALLETIELTVGSHKTENTMKAWAEALGQVMDLMQCRNKTITTPASK